MRHTLSLSKPPVAAESLLSHWEHIPGPFLSSPEEQLNPLELQQLSTPSTGPGEGRVLLLGEGWFYLRAAVPGAPVQPGRASGVCREAGIQQQLPTWHLIQAERTSPLLN